MAPPHGPRRRVPASRLPYATRRRGPPRLRTGPSLHPRVALAAPPVTGFRITSSSGVLAAEGDADSVLRTSAVTAFSAPRRVLRTTPITTAPPYTPVMPSTVQQLDHCADSLRTGQVLARLVASGDFASLVPSDSLRSSSAPPLRVRVARCGLRCHRLPHYPVHLCPDQCTRLRQCARHDRLHYLPHSPPLSRRGGSPPPGSPAPFPLRLCPWFLRS